MDRKAFLSPFQGAQESNLKSPKQIETVRSTHKVSRGLSTGISPYSGAWGYKQAAHLIRRTMFGATVEEINYFISKGMGGSVDELLTTPTQPPAPPINAYNTGAKTDPNIASGQTWVNAAEDPNFNGERVLSFKAWWLGQAINQTKSIQEKMVVFWHNHFATEINVYNSAILAYNQNALLRANAVGNFKTLVKAITLDGSMLKYLNGELNTKAAPDENYARELQELFTVGKDLNPHYTEDDVKAAARVLTGWRVSNSHVVSFSATKHDTADKQFSSFYGNTKIIGDASANGGNNELDALLNMIFSHEEVSRFICRKLYRFFVYYEIDAATEQNVIIPLSAIFRQNNYDIKPVLSALLKSEHFYDAANMGCLIKPPIDYVAGLCRQTYLKFPDPVSDYDTLYKHWTDIWAFTFAIGQNLGDPPNVAGWPAYYQVPAYHELWINSDSLPKRNQIADVYSVVGYKKGNFTVQMDLIAISKKMSDPSDPNKLIDDLCNYLHASLTLSASSKTAIKISALLSGLNNDSYWTAAWNDHLANPNDATKKQIVTYRLMLLYRFLLDLSEYQLS